MQTAVKCVAVLVSPQRYRGHLMNAEDNMNCHLSNCTKTAKDGRVTTLAK